MSGLLDLLGGTLIDKDGQTSNTSELLGQPGTGRRVLGIYFSAHWCPPCRGFTPELATFYTKYRASGERDDNILLEIIFASSDSDEDSFKEYMNEMPWKAIPYADRDRKETLSKKFKVRGIPTLVFLDADSGKLICDNGRQGVSDDPEGSNFPWPKKSLSELLSGEFLKGEDKVDSSEALAGKVKGFYFSAHWCPPCRAFTPELVKTYEKVRGNGKSFEIIFATSDRTEDAFKEYYGTMPWLAFPFKDPRIAQLSSLFEVEGIPMLVLLDENNEIITTNGRSALGKDKDGLNFPWPAEAVDQLDQDTASALNESACLLLLTGGDGTLISAAKDLIEDTAKSYIQEQKASVESDKPLPELVFLYEGNESAEIAESIRSFAKIEGNSAKLVLIDIIEQRIFISPDVEFTKDTIRQVIDDFKNGKLEFDQLIY